MLAKQRHDAIDVVTRGHQYEAFARVPKRLPQLESLLRRIRKPKKKVDQSAAVAALLERLAKKGQERAKAPPGPESEKGQEG